MLPNPSPKFIPFPSVGQFREAVFNTRALAISPDTALPTVNYTGHVKLHGTNAAVVYYEDGTFHCQSRQEIIRPGKDTDNAGFATWAYPKAQQILDLSTEIKFLLNSKQLRQVAVFGEWCGSKISPNVALRQLPNKVFVVFALAYITDDWNTWHYCNLNEFVNSELGIYNTNLFPTYPITVDFNSPQKATEQLQIWVNSVEDECPAGKYFKVTGIGEGIVFTANDPFANPLGNFKVKGSKHEAAAAIIAAADPIAIAEFSSLIDLIMRKGEVESRTAQAVRVLKEQGCQMNSMLQTKSLVEWLIADIIKENTLDIEASRFNLKSVLAACTKIGREDYKQILDALI
jgi:hypothetical protein